MFYYRGIRLYNDAGHPQQYPTVSQHPPPGFYPTGQQLPNQSADFNAPPDYSAGKFIVR